MTLDEHSAADLFFINTSIRCSGSTSCSKNVSLLTPSSWSSSSPSSRLPLSLMLKPGAIAVILASTASARSLSALNLAISSISAFSLWTFSVCNLCTASSRSRSALSFCFWDSRRAISCSSSCFWSCSCSSTASLPVSSTSFSFSDSTRWSSSWRSFSALRRWVSSRSLFLACSSACSDALRTSWSFSRLSCPSDSANVRRCCVSWVP
mmetsp:Transcript_35101/g.74063  ORF Transcript_35101/g.74063 Transcript_35101/m.74063 type:complete len:208 (+) Transcript_35101:2594-3217(+)